MKRQDELRKLPAASVCKVADILEINNDWQKVMSLIPKNIQSEHFEPKYNSEHMRLIEEYAKKSNRKCAEILFDEWGTSGRVRPTLDTLMKLLVKAGIYRAADEVANMLEEPIPNRPEYGPEANITISISNELNNNSVEQGLDSMDSIKSDNFHNSSQDHNLCNRSTKQIDPSDLIVFSESYIPEMVDKYGQLAIGHQPLPQGSSNLLKFPNSTISSSDHPDFSALIPKVKNNINSFSADEPSNYSTQILPSSTSQYVPNMNIFHEKIDNDILQDKNLVHFEYAELEKITNEFTNAFTDGLKGPVGKIGKGGFGEVFVGTHKIYGQLAVKRVHFFSQINCEPETAIKIFNTEVKSLAYLRHENIVPILGYSLDGPTPCIICKYIEGGSLHQKIAAKVLNEYQRISIMKGTAEGLKYIHNSERPPQNGSPNESQVQTQKKSYYLHGDVKSANILLTRFCVPKLCDFGLAKQLDTTFITKSMMGTSAYMAPEGFSGTVTQKNDIFSFGIVLLELLTGLTPIVNAGGESTNIKNYVEDNYLDGGIACLLDPIVEKWTTAEKVYELANCCLVTQKNQRPTIDEVCNVLNGITTAELF